MSRPSASVFSTSIVFPRRVCSTSPSFIDRPLGVFKHPLEPDQTLLLSYEAFSRSLAEARLHGLAYPAERDHLRAALPALDVVGLPLSAVQFEERRIVSLADAGRAADDFLLLRTTRQSVADFLAQYDFAPLAGRFDLDFLTRDRQALVVLHGLISQQAAVVAFDYVFALVGMVFIVCLPVVLLIRDRDLEQMGAALAAPHGAE